MFLPGLHLVPKIDNLFCAIHSLWASINSFGQQIQDVQIKFHKAIFLILTSYVSTGQKVKLTCVSASRVVIKNKAHPFEHTQV